MCGEGNSRHNEKLEKRLKGDSVLSMLEGNQWGHQEWSRTENGR